MLGGYNFAQPPVSKAHDLHHEKFNVNYGSLHFMDWLHGTDAQNRNQSMAGESVEDYGAFVKVPFSGTFRVWEMSSIFPAGSKKPFREDQERPQLEH